MPAIFIRHRVADFDKWLDAFEAHMVQRRAFGAQKSVVWQDVADENNVFILVKVRDLGQAREFIASEDLKQAMQAAGVVDEPTVSFLENARQFDG
jgi:hypothetical protein